MTKTSPAQRDLASRRGGNVFLTLAVLALGIGGFISSRHSSQLEAEVHLLEARIAALEAER